MINFTIDLSFKKYLFFLIILDNNFKTYKYLLEYMTNKVIDNVNLNIFYYE